MGLFDFFKKSKDEGDEPEVSLEEAAEGAVGSEGAEGADPSGMPAVPPALPPAVSSQGRRRRNSVPTAVAAPVMNPVLEQELLRDPNNLDVYLVYGQWLQARGDPRGELISIQHRLETQPGNAELKEANKVYMKGYQTYFLGDLELYKAYLKLRWRLGFIFSARIAESLDLDSPDVVKIISDLAAHDSARILQRLKLELRQAEDYKTYEQAVAALVSAGEWITIRQLVLNRVAGEPLQPAKHLNLEQLWPRFPNLEDLGLGLFQVDLGALELPKLRSLELKASCTGNQTMQSICKAKCPNLERLVLSCDQPTDGPGPQLDDLNALLQEAEFSHLNHLGLQHFSHGDALCLALPESKLIKNLESLDLSRSDITDQGAKTLVEHKEQLQGLKTLVLDGNCLTEEGVKSLEGLAPEVRTFAQRPAPAA